MKDKKLKMARVALQSFKTKNPLQTFAKENTLSYQELKRLQKRFLSNPNFRGNTLGGKRLVHVLHIGKTGGSAISEAMGTFYETENFVIVRRGHNIGLKDIPVGDKVVFFLRDPIKRYVSGFYSRKRKGAPKYNVEWTPCEEMAFHEFETPNSLARAIGSKEKMTVSKAKCAFNAIRHVNTHLSDWLRSIRYLEKRKGDILFIGFQETLDEDFSKVKAILGIPEEVSLPKDPKAAHRSNENEDKRIDDDSMEILKRWYHEDYEIYDYCKNKMNRIDLNEEE